MENLISQFMTPFLLVLLIHYSLYPVGLHCRVFLETEEPLHYDPAAGVYKSQALPAVCAFPTAAKPKALALSGTWSAPASPD